ncbi:unnamed protein product [Cercospora beticola]|nr:unnamed protein product [Cercospora beticola]
MQIQHLLTLSSLNAIAQAFCGHIYTDTKLDGGCSQWITSIMQGDCKAIGGQPTDCINDGEGRRYLWCNNVPDFHGPYTLLDPYRRTVTIYDQGQICKVCVIADAFRPKYCCKLC